MEAAEEKFPLVREFLPRHTLVADLAAQETEADADERKERDDQDQLRIDVELDQALGSRGVKNHGREQTDEKEPKQFFHEMPPYFGINTL